MNPDDITLTDIVSELIEIGCLLEDKNTTKEEIKVHVDALIEDLEENGIAIDIDVEVRGRIEVTTSRHGDEVYTEISTDN